MSSQQGVTEISRNIGLDIFRSTAIILVLIGHYEIIATVGKPHLYYSFGFLGVEIFFVLSGFLIGGILFRTMESGISWASIRKFWMRRWMRTLPLYYLVLLIRDLFFDPLGDGNISYYFFLQTYIAPGDPAVNSWFGESWSLVIEEWFYIFMPLVLAVVFRGKRKIFLTLLVLLSICMLWPAMRGAFLYFSNSPEYETQLRKFFPMRFDALLYGILLALLRRYYNTWYLRLSKGPVALSAFLLLLGCLFAGNILIYDFESEKLIPGSIGFSLLSILIAFTLPFFERNRFNFLKERVTPLYRFIHYTSIFSYCLYLIHLPIYVKIIGTANAPSVWIWAKLVGCCVLAYIISYFSYNYFEEPILKWRDKIFVEKHA